MALGTSAQQAFENLTPEEQRLVRGVQQKALQTIVNTSSASADAVRAVTSLLQQSIGDLSCVTALRDADPDATLNAMPFGDAVMRQIVTPWMESLSKNHTRLTGRRMTGLVISKGADAPSYSRDVAFTGLNTVVELLELDGTLRRRLECVNRGCLLDTATRSVDEERLHRLLRAARRSHKFAHLFVPDVSGVGNTVCTYGLGGNEATRHVAAGRESNVARRLEVFEETHSASIYMRLDGCGLEPGLMELTSKLTAEEAAACQMQLLVTLPTLKQQLVVEGPLRSLDPRESGRMPADAMGYLYGESLCEFLQPVLLAVADAHGDEELLEAVCRNITPEYAGRQITTAVRGHGLAAGMQMTPVLTCLGVPIFNLAPGRTKEVGEKLGLPFLDVLPFEPAANRPIDPAALPERLDVPTDRAAKFKVSELLGALSGLPSSMTCEEYAAKGALPSMQAPHTYAH